jgi:hypothetical protein
MEQQVPLNTKKHWALFFFWLIVISVMLYLPSTRPFFWLVLPFVVTEFAKAKSRVANYPAFFMVGEPY